LKKTTPINLFFLGLVCILLAWQLFIPPALSVADDNDFQKLAGRYCLGPRPGHEPVLFDYTSLRWYYSPGACIDWHVRTLAEGVFAIASGLNRVFNSRVEFDLRWMGFVYSLIFVAGFAYLQRALSSQPLRVSIAAQAACILAVCNAVYIPWFNTFYFDTLTLAALTGAIAGLGIVVLRESVDARALLMAAFWLALVAGSKSQHAPIALVCVPLFWLPLGRRAFAPVWSRAAATILVLAAGALTLGTVPAGDGGRAPFSALFYRMLPTVPDPGKYLAETKIPPSWVRYTGEYAFGPGSPILAEKDQAQFAEWFGPSRLILFYARHPVLAWRVAEVNLYEASIDRLRMKMGAQEHRLGNYERATGKEPQALSYFFCAWPVLKHAVISGRPLVFLAWILAAAGAAWWLAPPVPRMRVLLAFLTLCLAVAWIIGMLDGLDAGRHLTVFNFLLDLLICVDVSFSCAPTYLSQTAVFPAISALT
jgi:hypothetical protein